MDSLIRNKATGNTASLARKFHLSKAAIYKLLQEMKDEGFPICYCKRRRTYYYTHNGKMPKKLFEIEMDKNEMKRIKMNFRCSV